MTQQQTVILRQADIAGMMSLQDYIDAVEQAFVQLATGRMAVPDVVHLSAQDGAFHVKSAGFVEEPHYIAVKVNGNFPNNDQRFGLPTIQGAIILCDARNGSLLAVMDSIEVTAMRTGAATAVAARYLAPEDSSTATIIGCGLQGRVQLLSIAAVLPLDTVYAFDTNRARRDAFVKNMAEETGLKLVAVDDFVRGTSRSRVIVTCTSSRRPFLFSEHVPPGTFIAAVGADNDDKQELDPKFLAKTRLVADLVGQCAQIGELHHALKAGVMTRNDVTAELGTIVAQGGRPTFNPSDVVVFDSTGSAIQDVAAAGIIYERARARGVGLAVEFA